MNNTTPSGLTDPRRAPRALGVALGLVCTLGVMTQTLAAQENRSMAENDTSTPHSETLDDRQRRIVPIAAFAAAGDMAGLNRAINQGLDAGLTISEAREVLVQLYAYAGFPRSLNALGELMKVVQARQQQAIVDQPGREPSKSIPKGDELLAVGTANQTKLSGAPVEGALFDFAPVANEYLRTHLFGDIFERDNLDWQSREIATVAMLSALEGVAPQLQAHIRIAMNTGVTPQQLRQLIRVLAEQVSADASRRASEALELHLAAQ
ncbi:carboxymuconolactone decarboxylase family protein [Pseudomonas sp. BGr12]|uniref:carboxymuconolactone decarboxylase family protein n=1 Tax=unclassified Pseudomonas TaxID=196821 RepID=UPI00385B997D